MLFPFRMKWISFIISAILFLIPINSHSLDNDDKNEIVLYENHMISDAMKILIPTVVIASSIYIALNEDMRWYFADRWTRITSPNHMGDDQQRDFYIKPWSEQVMQKTQCDKGVHFIFPYLPLTPVATILDRTYYTLAKGKIQRDLSDWSVWMSAGIIFGFGFLEEYIDGYQIGEGFDLFDLGANLIGTSLALLKHYKKLEHIDFFWSFNRKMFKESPYANRYPFWIYMAGYEFAVNIDIGSIILDRKQENVVFNTLIKTPGYIPDLRKLSNSEYR